MLAAHGSGAALLLLLAVSGGACALSSIGARAPYAGTLPEVSRRLFSTAAVVPVTQAYLGTSAVNRTPDGKHAGIDFDGSHPVYSPVSGKVKAAGGPCGAVVIEDGRALSTWPGATARPRHVFLHLEHVAVEPGEEVAPGGFLGISSNVADGTRCIATGPHLHYEIRKDYTGTSAVGLFSCRSPGCTTADLTYDPQIFPYP